MEFLPKSQRGSLLVTNSADFVLKGPVNSSRATYIPSKFTIVTHYEFTDISQHKLVNHRIFFFKKTPTFSPSPPFWFSFPFGILQHLRRWVTIPKKCCWAFLFVCGLYSDYIPTNKKYTFSRPISSSQTVTSQLQGVILRYKIHVTCFVWSSFFLILFSHSSHTSQILSLYLNNK